MSLQNEITAELKKIAQRDGLTDLQKEVIYGQAESRGYYELAAEMFYAAWTQDHSLNLVDWLTEQVKDSLPPDGARTCTGCGDRIVEGYQVDAAEIRYYCTDDCLMKAMSPDEFDKAYDNDTAFWTQW